MFWRIALRNVFRNRRRTVLSLGITALGVAILHLALGFVSYIHDASMASIASELGAVQIADTRLFDHTSDGYEYLIGPEVQRDVEALLREDDRITGHAGRLGFSGLIGDREGSTMLAATGLVPGNPMGDFSDSIAEGQALQDDGSPQIIVGRKLAERLDAAPGDVINIATGTASGSFNAASATLAGTVVFYEQVREERAGIVPLAFAQRLMRTDGVERILVKIADLAEADEVADALDARLSEAGLGGLEARTWQELYPAWEGQTSFFNVFSGFTGLVIVGLLFFSILEVLTMSFLERTREVGSIRAIGTHRWQVFRMFVREGVVMGFLGGLIGIGIGLATSTIVNASGVTWVAPSTIEPQPLVIGATPTSVVTPFVIALVASSIGALYPAWKSARLQVVKALSYV